MEDDKCGMTQRQEGIMIEEEQSEFGNELDLQNSYMALPSRSTVSVSGVKLRFICPLSPQYPALL